MEWYTLAIEKLDCAETDGETEAPYYSDRAAAHLGSFTSFGTAQADDLALADSQKCTELDPAYARGFFRLGSVLKATGGGEEETHAAFARALELDPDSAIFDGSIRATLEAEVAAGDSESLKDGESKDAAPSAAVADLKTNLDASEIAAMEAGEFVPGMRVQTAPLTGEDIAACFSAGDEGEGVAAEGAVLLGTVTGVVYGGNVKVLFDECPGWRPFPVDKLEQADHSTFVAGGDALVVKELRGSGEHAETTMAVGTVMTVRKVDTDDDVLVRTPGATFSMWALKRKEQIVPFTAFSKWMFFPPLTKVKAVRAFNHGDGAGNSVDEGVEVGDEGVVKAHDNDEDDDDDYMVVEFGGELRLAHAENLAFVEAPPEGTTSATMLDLVVAGMRVRAVKTFDHNGREDKVPVGTYGTVCLIDGSGDFKIAFDAPVEGLRWSVKAACEVEPLVPTGSGEHTLYVGKTTEKLVSGARGIVKKVDDDGDYYVTYTAPAVKNAWHYASRKTLVVCEPPIVVGSRVEARCTFHHNKDKESKPVQVGERGVVRMVEDGGTARMDDDRYLVHFEEGVDMWATNGLVEVRCVGPPDLLAMEPVADLEDGFEASLRSLGCMSLDSYEAAQSSLDGADNVKHRVLIMVAASDGGFGKGDKAELKEGGFMAVIKAVKKRGSYDLLMLDPDGNPTGMVLPNIHKSKFHVVEEVVSGSDDLDLLGPLGGDIAHVMNTLGQGFGMAISKRTGTAMGAAIQKETIKAYFEERDWPWDYYWLYYSGHGRSADGGWCLPGGTYLNFDDIRTLWQASSAKERGARLVIVSDSCYAGRWCDLLRESGDDDIAVQSASVADHTSGDAGIEAGGVFTKNWCALVADTTARVFKAGDACTVTCALTSKGKSDVPANTPGVVHKVDEDGDYLVEFEGCESRRWSYKSRDQLRHPAPPSLTESVAMFDKFAKQLFRQGSDCWAGWQPREPIGGSEFNCEAISIENGPVLVSLDRQPDA